jgi:peptidoglycan LD-endopeptidase LytH
MSRLTLLALVAVTACSQRSPWVASPTAAPRSPAAPTQTTSQQATPKGVALATVAALPSADAATVGSLYFPVAGYDGKPLADSYEEARDGGDRRHNAIDILAPRGTPVLSVQDGRILRLSKSSKGGTTIYATDLEEQYVFYYAHLDRYHTNIYAGKPLLRGDTLGYVGTTGNAPENTPHLHFQMMRMPADRKYWNGEPINPYPFLRPLAPGSSSQ